MKRNLKFGFKQTIYAGYVGYIVQAIVNNLAPLLFLIFRDEFSIEISKITLIVTANFLIQLGVDYLSTKFVDKIGYRTCIVAAHIFSAAGLVGLAVFPQIFPTPYFGIMTAVVIYALGGGLIEVLISPIIEACPTENKTAQMSLLHSFYCWGSVAVVGISTLFLHFVGKSNWQILVLLWAIVPILNGLFFTAVPINTLTEDGEGMSNKELFKNKTFWLFVLLMVASGASEQAMSQWASAFAESGLNVSKTVGDLAGPCMFSLLMGASRVISAKIEKHISLGKMMICSGILCIVSYLIAALCANPVLALAGCGLCGLSVGVLWPGTFSLASKNFKRGSTALFALLALAGDLGCTAGPTLVGEIAGKSSDSIKNGLLIAVIFPILLIIACVIENKSSKKADTSLKN